MWGGVKLLLSTLKIENSKILRSVLLSDAMSQVETLDDILHHSMRHLVSSADYCSRPLTTFSRSAVSTIRRTTERTKSTAIPIVDCLLTLCCHGTHVVSCVSEVDQVKRYLNQPYARKDQMEILA